MCLQQKKICLSCLNDKHNIYIIKIILEFEKQTEINNTLKSILTD